MAQKYFGLQWHITDSCDQRCKHCYIYAGKDLCKNNDLPFEKLSVILQDFIITCKKMKRTPFISVTGGDPLLYKNVWDFVELLKQNNIKFAILGNPFHITDEVAMKLKDYGCINYQMSLDGLEATHDFIRKKGSFTATLSKLNCLRKAGIATTIMATVSKSNIDEIPNLVDTVVKYEVDNFAFARYCPNPDDFQNIVSAEEYHEFLGTMWEKFISYKDSHTKFVLKDHLWTLFLYENGLFNIDNVENSLQNNIDNIHKIRYHTSFNVNLADSTSTTEGNIAFTDYIYNYNKIIIDLSNIELGGSYGFFRFFRVATIQLSNTDRLIIYETMNYNSTNYIYVSYSSAAHVPIFNAFRTLSSSENMEYYLKGKMSGTINVYAS